MIRVIIPVMLKLIKNAKSKYFYYLACHGNEWACSKEKKVFYFSIKIPNLNLY